MECCCDCIEGLLTSRLALVLGLRLCMDSQLRSQGPEFLMAYPLSPSKHPPSPTSGGGINLAWPLTPSQTSTDAPLRAFCWAVSPHGTTTPSVVEGLSRGWYGHPNASPGAHCLPSRTSTAHCHRKTKIIKDLSHHHQGPQQQSQHQSWDKPSDC